MLSFVRCVVFNILFYGLTAVVCVIYLPTLLLPRATFIKALWVYFKFVHLLEKYILRLDYVVEGLEHLPQGQAYMVASKHQSAYETMKLHLLFDDPCIILKRELLSIPLWGWYARKAKLIPVDRGKREESMRQIITGAKENTSPTRPLVIYPQGTRTPINAKVEDMPYRNGIMRLYGALDLPVTPMALNSGHYWPRNSFFKKPGIVTFKFLPAIQPGLSTDDFRARLQSDIEQACKTLPYTPPKPDWSQKIVNALFIAVLLLFLIWSIIWHVLAYNMKENLATALNDTNSQITYSEIYTSGFPTNFTLRTTDITVENNGQDIRVPVFEVTQDLTRNTIKLDLPEGLIITPQLYVERARIMLEFIQLPPRTMRIEDLQAWQRRGGQIIFSDLTLERTPVILSGDGVLSLDDQLKPHGQINLSIVDFNALLDEAERGGQLTHQTRQIVMGLLTMFGAQNYNNNTGTATIQLSFKDGALYIGIIRLADLLTIHEYGAFIKTLQARINTIKPIQQ